MQINGILSSMMAIRSQRKISSQIAVWHSLPHYWPEHSRMMFRYIFTYDQQAGRSREIHNDPPYPAMRLQSRRLHRFR
jgi:hypothetical protein